jgi:hypothetical protein
MDARLIGAGLPAKTDVFRFLTKFKRVRDPSIFLRVASLG